MNQRYRKDLVVDANVMRLYDKPKDKAIVALFKWIKKKGVLSVNQKLINEYAGSGNRLVMILINELIRDDRLNRIQRKALSLFTLDRHFHYRCNRKDIIHARTVFLSNRKCCIAFDKKLREDINRFKKVDGIKPCSCCNPKDCCLN